MKNLTDCVHGLGLKIGIYSTRMKISYAKHTGGWGMKNGQTYWYYKEDIRQWVEWGFDYLKYDGGYTEQEAKEVADALRPCGRDIIYSLSCGPRPSEFMTQFANCWRTTGDISANWHSVEGIGFSQDPLAGFAGPGHWNDADMLEVGNGLTPNECYTHMSMWCLLASPLLMGNDVRKLAPGHPQFDELTLSILSNDEVLAVNQDALGKQARRVSQRGALEVWAKDLEDGSKTVGLFSRWDYEDLEVVADWSDLKIKGKQVVRDLWQQKDLGVFEDRFAAIVPAHGVVMLKITPQRD
jgi:alpha-galactosidase